MIYILIFLITIVLSIVQVTLLPVNLTLVFVVGWLLFFGEKYFPLVILVAAISAAVFANLPIGMVLLIYLLASGVFWVIANALPQRSVYKIALLLVSLPAWELFALLALKPLGAV